MIQRKGDQGRWRRDLIRLTLVGSFQLAYILSNAEHARHA